MAINPPLFPDHQTRQHSEAHLSHVLEMVRQRTGGRSVAPDIDLDAFRRALAEKTFDRPEELDTLINWTIESLKHGMVQMTHPGCFGLFNPSPSFAAECADRIASAFNPQICVWSHAPVAVEIEKHVIAHIAQRAGLPAGSGGHFTSGGAEANNTALICALSAASPDYAEQGARAFAGQPRLYASAESHLAWLKIAHMNGIGRTAVRLIATDGSGRMDQDALAQTIKTDITAGDVPVMIAATAGTTNAGMVDPLNACADIAKRHSLWYHIDAAWGGALIASPKYRAVLDGLSRADSITIDAHKWFATTMGAGMFLTRKTAILAQAFRVSTDYMPDSNVVDDYYVTSVQWSRRFVGLRLFLSLGAAGWDGYARHMENAIQLMEHLITRLTALGWTHENASSMAVGCFTPPKGADPVEVIVERVVQSGKAWVSVARFEGRAVLRACVTNGHSTMADIDILVDEITKS
ncbi:MAG: pyridoxal-dependent decarboxylase [Robiginitomaculum sp.]|nr:pyridoxal-dependent decarboxylase [Robiginitomaculum sp.]MDQ7076278.1 pyridoxal-dependent decarboxylase [Robiginitomaculum sp.]